MKIIKPVLITFILSLGIFCGVLYTSCSKDGCKGVNCLNGCSCSGGQCGNPKPGIGGVNCETIYRSLYPYTYKGVVNFNGHIDSLTTIDSNFNYDLLAFSPNSGDTMNYETMTVLWQDSTGTKLLVTLPIILTQNAASGSDFTVPSIAADSFTYSGYGNVSTVSASMYLTRISKSTSETISFNSFTRK
jgi:hypothetical protein